MSTMYGFNPGNRDTFAGNASTEHVRATFMNSNPATHDEKHLDLVFLCALDALPSTEMKMAEAQISVCEECRREMETLRPLIPSFVSRPADILRAADLLWGRGMSVGQHTKEWM